MRIRYEYEGYVIDLDTSRPGVYEIRKGNKSIEGGKRDSESEARSAAEARIDILKDDSEDHPDEK